MNKYNILAVVLGGVIGVFMYYCGITYKDWKFYVLWLLIAVWGMLLKLS